MHFPILEQTLRSNAKYEKALNSIRSSINTDSVVPDQLTPLFIYTIWKDLDTNIVLITPNEAQVVSSVIEVYRKVIETTELESRIIELEKVSNE